MTFELDKSRKQILKAAWEFARGEFDKDRLLELEKAGQFPEEIWKKAAELGFIGLHFDEDFSGAGLGLFETVLTAEAFCRKDSSCGMALMLSGFSGELVMDYGTAEQKRKYLEPLSLGWTRSGGGFFEPELGYDLSAIKTTVREKDGSLVISGSKTWVANGTDSDFYTILCKTGESVEKTGIVLLVDKDAPGLTITPMPRKLGNTMTPWAVLQLNNVKVEPSSILGKPDKGYQMVKGFLNQVGLLNAGMALGIAQGAMDRALYYAKEREQFGRKIAEFESLRHKIAEMALRIESARGIVYGAAIAYDKKIKAPVMPVMAMEHACEVAEFVTDEALQIHGGYGYMHEGEVEHFYRDAKFLRLFCSNPKRRKEIIAENVIGKLKPVNNN